MLKKKNLTDVYANQPCERCGSKKRISKPWKEKIKTTWGISVVEASQIFCTNDACQKLFDKNRAEEVIKINARKLMREEQVNIRKEHIAYTIALRKKNKLKLSI